MQIAGVHTHRFRERFQEGHHIVLHHFLDCRDALRVNPRVTPYPGRHPPRYLSTLLQRLAGQQFDL